MDDVQEGPTTEELPPDDKPLQSLNNEERAARGLKPKGRPKGSGQGTAPRQSRGKRNLQGELQTYLTLVNFMFLLPAVPDEIRQDMMDDVEISALAKAINDAAHSNKRFYEMLDKALTGGQSGMITLVIIAGCMAGRRLSRHGILPESMDSALGNVILTVHDPEKAAEALAVAIPQMNGEFPNG